MSTLNELPSFFRAGRIFNDLSVPRSSHLAVQVIRHGERAIVEHAHHQLDRQRDQQQIVSQIPNHSQRTASLAQRIHRCDESSLTRVSTPLSALSSPHVHFSTSVAPYKYARDETRSPCICLTCGELVVRAPSTTSNPTTTNSIMSTLFNIDQTVGPCNTHTQQCSGSIGLYLRVKECSLLLLNVIIDGRTYKTRGTLIPAPYLDEYGETDQNLR